MTLYVDRFVHATIERALHSSKIEFFADQLAEAMIAYALSSIANKQLKRKSTAFENPTNALSHASPRDISKRESMDSLVQTLAQQIYSTSMKQLRW